MHESGTFHRSILSILTCNVAVISAIVDRAPATTAPAPHTFHCDRLLKSLNRKLDVFPRRTSQVKRCWAPKERLTDKAHGRCEESLHAKMCVHRIKYMMLQWNTLREEENRMYVSTDEHRSFSCQTPTAVNISESSVRRQQTPATQGCH